MNVTKLFDNITSFEDYLSLSRRILNNPQYAIKNLQFNAATLSSLMKFIAYEIEYYNKYNEVGAAFTVFTQILQIQSTKRTSLNAEITSIFCALLEAVKNNYIIQTGKWNFLHRIMKNINISCCNNQGMSSALVQQISEHLLILATDNSFHYFQKIQILLCINNCCYLCSKEVRLQKFEKLKSYFIKLAHSIVECEDFYGQLIIMQTLMKWFVHREDPIKKAEIAKDWFPCHIFNKKATNFFLTCTFENFLEDMREFLNIQNEITKLIVSVKCRKLRVGNKVLVSSEESHSSWLDVNVMVKQLSVILDTHKFDVANDPSQRLELLMIHHQNINIARLDKGSEYILSIRMIKPPDFLFMATEEIVQDDATNITVIIEPKSDMTRFENTLRDILCEKLILHHVPDQRMPLQPATSRMKLNYYGVMREPKTLKTPSTTSTTSLMQLCGKIASAPNNFMEGKYEGVIMSPRLSVVEEMTEHSTPTIVNDVKRNSGTTFETSAIIHPPKPSCSNKCNIEEMEKVLKVHELNDLDAIEEGVSEIRCDNLDEVIVNELLKEAFNDTTDACQNENNNNSNERKMSGHIYDDLQKNGLNEPDSQNRVNGFCAANDSNSNSIISDTPMCYINTRARKHRDNKEAIDKKYLAEVNADVIEDFFSQHIKQREDGNVVISPSVARRINKSSSSSEISESFVGIGELIEISDLVDQTKIKVSEEQPVSGNIDIEQKKRIQRTDTYSENETDYVAGDSENDIQCFSSQNSIACNSKSENSKYDTTLIFNLDDIKNSGTTQAEKQKTTPKPKKGDKKGAVMASLHTTKNITMGNKSETTGQSQKQKRKSIPSKVKETTRTLRKRRTLFYPNLDQIEEREIDAGDSQSKVINESSTLTKNPEQKSFSSVYEKIEKEKPKRFTRNIKPRTRKSGKKIGPDACPRTTERNDLFERVKNSENLNPVPVNTANVPRHNANNIAIYNFTSDSEENFITDTTEKPKLPKLEKLLADKKNQDRTRRKLFTDETKRIQIKKKKITKKNKTKTKDQSNSKTSKNCLIDERMRDAPSNNHLLPDTSIAISNIDNVDTVDVFPPKVNISPVMEAIPANSQKSKHSGEFNMKKIKKTDEAQNVPRVTHKNEDTTVQERAKSKEVSPLPGLIIEAVSSHDDVKDSTISTNAITKIKNFFHNINDMRENITDSPINIAEIENIDNEMPLHPTSVDQEITAKAASDIAHMETSGSVVIICSSEGDKNEKTINTLKTRSPIDGHGNSEEVPPDPRVLKKMETPRDIETENFVPEIQKYYSEFSNKLNALYEKDSSDVSKNSNRQLLNKLLNPKVVIEKLPENGKSFVKIDTPEFPVKVSKSLPVNEHKFREFETKKPNLSHWVETCDKMKRTKLVRKTMPARRRTDLVVNQTHQLENSENVERIASTTLKTSSPKEENNDLMFNIRHLEVKISPIKNICLKDSCLEEMSVTDSNDENKMCSRKNIARNTNFSYRELMNMSRRKNYSVLPVSGEEPHYKKSYLRSTTEKSEDSGKDDKSSSEYRNDNKSVKDLFSQLHKAKVPFENRQQVLHDKSDEEACPQVTFQKTLKSLFGTLEENDTTETTFKKDLRNIFGVLEKTDTTDATSKMSQINVANKTSRTIATEVTPKGDRHKNRISQRELRDIINCMELKDACKRQNDETIQSSKYYLRSVVDSQSYSETKEISAGNAVRAEESRKRMLVDQLNLLNCKKQKVAVTESQRTRSEIGSTEMGTSRSVVHWLENAMQSSASDGENVVQRYNEIISNILERLDTTYKESNRETSLSYLKASADVLNELTETKIQIEELLDEIKERWGKRITALFESFKEQIEDITTKGAKKNHLMMNVLREELLNVQTFLSTPKAHKKN